MFDVRMQGGGDDVLVLLYGTPVPAQSLDPMPEWFADDYRVLIPETVGCGIDIEEAHAMLVKTLRERGVESATFVGHSCGAYRALRMAIDDDIEVKKVVTIGAVAHLPQERQAQYDEMADAIDAGEMEMKDMVDVAMELWFHPEFVAENPDIRGEVEGWFDAIGMGAVLGCLRREMRGPDLNERLDEIDCPIHLIVGDGDVGTPPEWSEAIAEATPKATLEVFDDCGHFPHIEQPEKTEAVLRGILGA